MKKILITYLIVFLCTDYLAGQEYTIEFEDASWEEIIKIARKEKKLIFLDAYATWCRPCKEMEYQTFTDPKVGKFYNKNFVNVRFDMEEPGDGQFLSSLFEIKSYPSLVFVDPQTGDMQYKVEGLLYPDDFLSLGKMASEEIPKSIAYKIEFEKGNRQETFLSKYVQNIEVLNLEIEEPILEYLRVLPEEKLLDSYHSDLIINYVEDVSSREFVFFLEKKELFESLVGVQTYDFKIYITFLSELFSILGKENIAEIESLITMMIEAKIEDHEEIVNYSFLHYHLGRQEYEKALEFAIKLETNPGILEEDIFNEVAWRIYENVDSRNEKIFEDALSVCRKSLMENDWSSNNDTYASLLYELGYIDLAINFERRAIELAKEEGIEDSDNYTYYLEKLNEWILNN